MRVRIAGACLAVVIIAVITVIVGNGPRENHEAFRRPQIGMTEQQILASDWGRPDEILKSRIAPHRVEYWFYERGHDHRRDHTGVILIDDGVVTYFRADVRP
jgi:hypothetical protein